MDNIDQLREAKRIIESGKYPNVEGVAIGYKYRHKRKTGEIAIIVYVSEKLPEGQLEAWHIIPKVVRVSGQEIKTDVMKSKFKALILADHDRPIKPGFSISHPNVTRGTLGFFALRRSLLHLVSCNHVIDDSNKAKIGDPVYYPGVYDGGTEKDTVAYLTVAIPIEMIDSQCPIANWCVNALNRLAEKFGSSSRIPKPIRQVTNRADCAAACIADNIEVDKNIYKIGEPVGIKRLELGMKVQKTGSTTEYTEGEIIAIEATLSVGYPQGIAVFEGQAISDIPSAGGDSGSAVLTYDNNLVGLLFAGGEGFTAMNPIDEVFKALELEI